MFIEFSRLMRKFDCKLLHRICEFQNLQLQYNCILFHLANKSTTFLKESVL